MSSIDNYSSVAGPYHQAVLDDPDGDRIPLEIAHGAGITGKTRRLLDVGCGEGTTLKKLAARFTQLDEAVGIDNSPSMLRIAQQSAESVKFVLGDMTHMPFPNGHFDVVYARFAVHHSSDLNSTFKEVARVTEPAGIFYVVDAHPILGLFLKGSRDYGAKESAAFPAWYDPERKVRHPCFMFSDYVAAITATGWEVISLNENFGRRSTAPEFRPFRIPLIMAFKLTRQTSA